MGHAGQQAFFEGKDVAACVRARDDDGFAHDAGSVSLGVACQEPGAR